MIKKVFFVILIVLLFYTRFVNLGWGLPYPMHPDERNMANAVQQLSCPPLISLISSLQSPITCLNPHFFAYGQLPLYLAYGGIGITHFLTGQTGQPTFIEATLALRTISALSSILLVFVLQKIVKLIVFKLKIKDQRSKLQSKNKNFDISFVILIFAFLFLIFQPYAIQFAHFGTTESILMLFFALIVYYSLCLLSTLDFRLWTRYILLLGLFSGLALGTKTSSAIFLGVPIIVLGIKIIGGSRGRDPDNATLPASQAQAVAGRRTTDRIYYFCQMIVFLILTLVFFALSSPQSILHWNDFINSMNYESAIGLGTYLPFYTRQFAGTTPLLFQFQNILPYVFGWPTLILGILGFFLLPSKVKDFVRKVTLSNMSFVKRCVDLCCRRSVRAMQGKVAKQKNILCELPMAHKDTHRKNDFAIKLDILRFSLLISLLPPSLFFAKWTRFIAPSFPLFSLFAILFFMQIFESTRSKIKDQRSKLQSKNKNFDISFVILIFAFCILILPGIAFLSVYLSPDVRFVASDWIYKNIPANAKILSETANVIDIPISPPHYPLQTKTYLLNSFNFYDLDAVPQLQTDLSEALKTADYIIVPSRRIFKNHPKNTYPLLNTYYEQLFSGQSGFEKVAEFSSYPRLGFQLSTFGFELPFPDENAEETWTVFDHPVIRIYKKISNIKYQISKKSQNTNLLTDFSNYKTMKYQLPTDLQSPITNLSLLIADTPEKWERGLMYVKNRADIGGLDGMIFTFPTNESLSFWNKNTVSHLKLYWINKGVLLGTSDMPAISSSGYISTFSSPAPADTVIEIVK